MNVCTCDVYVLLNVDDNTKVLSAHITQYIMLAVILIVALTVSLLTYSAHTIEFPEPMAASVCIIRVF